MAKVIPSDIVNYIDKVIPNASNIQRERRELRLDINFLGFLQSLLDFLDNIDDALLQLSPEDYICFIASKATIKSFLAPGSSRLLLNTSGFGNENPVIWIRRLLEKCPDSLVPPTVSGLEFIDDERYREMLRIDLASVEFLLNNNEWKAAMVIAGSAIEALLCDQISNIKNIDSNKFESAINDAISRGDIDKPPKDITYWRFKHYVHIAHELALISNKTKEQALLGGDFRNLVHPGKSIREEAACNRGSAHSVFAALEHVITDLAKL